MQWRHGSTIDDGAVRNTRDVNILLREQDLELATTALESAGFVREDYATAAPSIDQTIDIEGRSIVQLDALVEMKLNSFRRKDQTHLFDMIQIGLIDSSWPARFDKLLGDRLQELLDDPEG